MMKKRILCVLLALTMLLSACSPSSGRKPAPSDEVLATGKCGDNVTWTLDSNGLLTVSGTGAMANYSTEAPPWYLNRDKIKSVVIEDGVTSVGEVAFYDCGNLTSVTISDSVTRISRGAFRECVSLAVVNIGSGVITIGFSAFSHCDSLTYVSYSGEGILDIDDGNELLRRVADFPKRNPVEFPIEPPRPGQ